MAVSPNTGKTTARYMRVLINGHNLSGDIRAIGEMGASFSSADATGLSDDVYQYLTNRAEVMLTGFSALFSNMEAATGPVNAGSHIALHEGGTLDVGGFIGVRAVPAVGNPAFGSTFEAGGYRVSGDDGPVLVTGDFYSSATQPLSAKVWGVALGVGTEVSATGAAGSVDGGASSTGGWIAYLHTAQTSTAQASNDYAFVIEHSSNDSDWSTLDSFTIVGDAIESERIEDAGTVNRYVRLKYTKTAGVARPWCIFIRK